MMLLLLTMMTMIMTMVMTVAYTPVAPSIRAGRKGTEGVIKLAKLECGTQRVVMLRVDTLTRRAQQAVLCRGENVAGEPPTKGPFSYSSSGPSIVPVCGINSRKTGTIAAAGTTPYTAPLY